jgi:hypothetical protein
MSANEGILPALGKFCDFHPKDNPQLYYKWLHCTKDYLTFQSENTNYESNRPILIACEERFIASQPILINDGDCQYPVDISQQQSSPDGKILLEKY